MKTFRYVDRDGKEKKIWQPREDSALPFIEKRLKRVVPKETVDADKLKSMVASIAIDCKREITPDEANTLVETIKKYIIQEIDNAEKFYLNKKGESE